MEEYIEYIGGLIMSFVMGLLIGVVSMEKKDNNSIY